MKKLNRLIPIFYVLLIVLSVFLYGFCLNPFNFLKKDINIGSGTQNKKTTISAVSESTITVKVLENSKILEDSNIKIEKVVDKIEIASTSVVGMQNSTITTNVGVSATGLESGAISSAIQGIKIENSKFNVSSNVVNVENTINVPAKFFIGTLAGGLIVSIIWIIIIILVIKKSKRG